MLTGAARHYPRRVDRQNLAIQTCVGLGTVHSDRGFDELAGIDHVRRTARMQHGLRIRQSLHQLTCTARMIEVHVREEHEVDGRRREGDGQGQG